MTELQHRKSALSKPSIITTIYLFKNVSMSPFFPNRISKTVNTETLKLQDIKKAI